MRQIKNKYALTAATEKDLVAHSDHGIATLTLFIYSSALSEIASMRVPIINCMGMIQDLRRPTEGKKRESTIGDHSSFIEYG